MSRTFFAEELDSGAHWWRIMRRDGVTLGFTTHDRDLWFDGVLHRAAPGMVPSAIRLTSDFAEDEADVEGAISHDAISATDLAAGRFDGARIVAGLVDWATGESLPLYRGTIDGVARDDGAFTAQLRADKAALLADTLPRTSPTCRARFCGPGCGLSPSAFTVRSSVTAIDPVANRVRFDLTDPAPYEHGELRWLDGPQTGMRMHILALSADGMVLDVPLAEGILPGMRALLREGCDRTIASCSGRFGNAINFRGEPFLPGNDLLAQYPAPR